MATYLQNFKEWLYNFAWILRQSLSSSSFYRNLYCNFSGYGIKYLLTISLLASLPFAARMLVNVEILSGYFIDGINNERTAKIDYIVNQLPIFRYDGKQIELAEGESASIIRDNNGIALIAIDPENTLKPQDRQSAASIMLKNAIIFMPAAMGRENLSIKYSQIFGDKAAIIDQSFIKDYISNILLSAPRIIIYLIYPLMSGFFFVQTLAKGVLTILLIYIITGLYYKKATIQKSMRIVCISSASVLLIEAFIVILIPALADYSAIFQLYVNILMILGLMKATAKSKN